MKTLKRYGRLYLKFVEFSIGRAMEFRLDFYFRIAMDLIYNLSAIGFFKVLFLHTSNVGGWSEPQVYIFIGCYIVVDAINMTLFSNNVWMLPYMINKGDLDYHIVRPVHSYFMVCFRDVAINSFVNLVFAVAFLVWALANYPEPLSAGLILLSISMLIVGSFLFHFMRMLFLLPVFWTQSGRGLDTLFWSMQKFMERPYGIYVGVARLIFLTALPFALMASVPTDILFAQNPWPLVSLSLVVTAIFLFLNMKVWAFGIRSYSSASS